MSLSVLSTTLQTLPLGAGWVVAQAQAAPQGGLLSSLPMFIAIIAIFYFLLIRPQQQEQKRHVELLQSLKKGDRVVTASGLHGKVFNVAEATVTIEVADKVRLTFDKAAIKGREGGAASGSAAEGSVADSSGRLKKKEN